ncbi:UNKNOWN [Stylonychia lemnae]|uniref:Uncharacterized protein n=1 Tax=Stylonychia lemnae TaxID=5949 RepID=A0A078AYE7_STYLE|nr:UNKNOWN [Stylonychia lemnae]|eukprot:CDW87189.1 UNKNOWN [Stylonychia lemnae]
MARNTVDCLTTRSQSRLSEILKRNTSPNESNLRSSFSRAQKRGEGQINTERAMATYQNIQFTIDKKVNASLNSNNVVFDQDSQDKSILKNIIKRRKKLLSQIFSSKNINKNLESIDFTRSTKKGLCSGNRKNDISGISQSTVRLSKSPRLSQQIQMGSSRKKSLKKVYYKNVVSPGLIGMKPQKQKQMKSGDIEIDVSEIIQEELQEQQTENNLRLQEQFQNFTQKMKLYDQLSFHARSKSLSSIQQKHFISSKMASTRDELDFSFQESKNTNNPTLANEQAQIEPIKPKFIKKRRAKKSKMDRLRLLLSQVDPSDKDLGDSVRKKILGMDDAREKRVQKMICGKTKINKFELIDDLSYC